MLRGQPAHAAGHVEGMAEFEAVARRLGHDLDALHRDQEVCSFLTVPTPESARRMLSHSDDAERSLRLRTFFHPAVAVRERLGQGMHDRGEAVVVAGAPVADRDRDGLARHYPIRVKAVSVLHRRVPAGLAWDVSVRGDRWGLDDLEDLYVTLNIGTLVLEPGARVVVRGNVFTMLCQRIVVLSSIRTTEERAEPAHQIGILPTPFSQDSRRGPHDGVQGAPGAPGGPGADGQEPAVRWTMFGPALAAPVDAVHRDGLMGTPGGPGGRGTNGRNGGPCKLAEITMRRIDGHVTVFGRSGQGGAGGVGGTGGQGGPGGCGARGGLFLSGPVAPGSGGPGGSGGDGGRGGHGGNGGIASNVYVTVRPSDAELVTLVSLPSSPGRGGSGGPRGPGGTGGPGGPFRSSAGSHDLASSTGPDGVPGRNGTAGRDGMSRPGPTMFLNGVPSAGSRAPSPETQEQERNEGARTQSELPCTRHCSRPHV